MMRKYYFVMICCFLLVLIACQEEEIGTYGNNADYIAFTKPLTDSSEFTFFFYPGKLEMQYPVSVSLVGTPLDEDRTYKLSVMDEFSEATTVNYDLPEECTFRAGRARDTCYVKMKYTSDLDKRKVKLVLRLEPTPEFLLGKVENRVAIIYIHNIVSMPAWWDSKVISRYLGVYSDTKYKLFITVTGKADLTGLSEAEYRSLALKFKKYLIQQKEADTPVLEDNGYEMEVPVLGN